MTEPSRGVLRVARTLAWTIAAGGLSTGAHLAAGGGLPSTGGMVLIVGLLLWSGLVLTQWRLGRAAMAVTLGGSQVVLHTLLSAGHPDPTCAVGGGHHEMVLGCAGGAEMSHTSPAMLLAHTVAALLLALVLARGEEAVWFLAGLLRPVLPRPARRVAVPLRAAAPAAADQPWRTPFVLGGVGRRGPPVRPAPTPA